ncbi:nitrous oxide reductase accessory protein NosL [Thiovibrio sp. JS02]
MAATERCPVCGMFVAKYPDWLGQIHLADGGIRFFDGVKDLLAFYHHPGEYGAGEASVKDIWVKDYYTLEWVDGRAAFYVIGSDIYGPMGHEFIPFASRPAAENFRKDHKGTDILSFAQITAELVRSLRTGQKMR